MSKKLTTEEFVKRAISVHSYKYNYEHVIYIDIFTKVEIYCNKHKEYFLQTPNDHLNSSHGCPKCGLDTCSKSRTLSTEEFIRRAKEMYGNKYDYSKVEYINNRTPVTIYCNSCKEYFNQSPDNHLANHGCQKCGGSKKLTKHEFIEKSKKVHSDKYCYDMVEYIDNHSNIKIYCKKHNMYFEQLPAVHLRGCGCTECGKEIRGIKRNTPKEEFIDRAIKIHGKKYSYDKIDYKNLQIKINIYCNKHKEYFLQTPASHLVGRGCPICKESQGERKIALFLDSLNIKYEREKRFVDCKNKRSLPFDFYLSDYNICIEYDGKQHFKPTDFRNVKDNNAKNVREAFELLKYNDEIKNKYCDKVNIKLVRIKYNENILEKLSFLKEIDC